MKKLRKQWVAMIVIAALLVGILPVGQEKKSQAANSPTGISDMLKNPQTDSNGNTTWSCVYFGNYWQNDTNGDGVADKKDKKEPIKWRVVSVNGDDAFLLADNSLDCQKYNEEYTAVTWETCTMRSWLNGYGADSNTSGNDYTSDNFMDNAFSALEQTAIKNTLVVNADNPGYNTEGGNNTTDKVYLLSIDEVLRLSYGFSSTTDAAKTREARNTAYAKEQGAWVSDFTEEAGNGTWWLRSPGISSLNAACVTSDGIAYWNGSHVVYDQYATRPVLHLNLSSVLGCSYAGTVSSDGNVTAPTNCPESTEETATAKPNTSVSPGASPGTNTAEEKIPQSIYAKSLTKPYGSKPFSLGAATNGEGALSYSSSSSKVAVISASGIVTVNDYGKTVITIRASETGNYLAAEKKITLTVVPKQVMIKKANSPSRRKIYFSWATDKSVAGYQIQLSSRKNFKMETVQRVYGKKKKSILITGIKSRKTYYVRIRAYQKIGKERYYGTWSKSRAIKIK